MIPLFDDQRSRSFPAATLIIILLNAYIFIGWQEKIGLARSLAVAGFIPGEYARGTPGAATHLITSMFMHGGWMHLIGNMWFLWVFGRSVEAACGFLRYLAFYILSGAAATLAFFWFSPHGSIPLVGASGAISGVLGAYLLRNPTALIATLVPFVIIFRVNIPAWVFLPVWVGIQIVSQLNESHAAGQHTGGIAYVAHIAGFIAGMGLIYFFEKPAEKESA